MFEAVLFDKDGTIFDSETMYCQSWVESAKAFNVAFTHDMYDQFVGVRADECYRLAHQMFGRDFPIDEFKRYNRNWINEKKALGVPFKSGFQQFFDKILTTKVPIGLVTSSATEATRLSFEPYPNYLDKFKIIVTGDMVTKAKPSPECYLKACKSLGVAPNKVLVFEDSAAGIHAALAAGCMVAAIPDYLPIEQTLLNQCHYVFESFEQAMFSLA